MLIASFLLAFIVSAMCSVAESVLLSLTISQIAEIKKKNNRIGIIWETYKRNVDRPITAILTLNTTAHTVGASLAGAAFAKLFGESWVWVFSLVFTFLMLQYTEILPKTLGVRFSKQLAFVIARPLALVIFICDPIIRLLRFLNRPFVSRSKPESINAVKELSLLTTLARSRRELDVEQEKIILATLKLSHTKVKEVMVPFDEVSLLSDELTTTQAIDLAQNDSHTRFPVYYETDSDAVKNIIGYVNFKQLVERRWEEQHSTEDCQIRNFVRHIIRVEADDNVSDVLRVLVKHHEHIALVFDPIERQNLGILTLEDLVEELVGEIEDEFDRLPETLRKSDDFLLVGGGALLTAVAREIKEIFTAEECADFEKEALAADQNTRFSPWFETKLGEENVVRNMIIDCGNLCITVRRARRGRVFDAKISRKCD